MIAFCRKRLLWVFIVITICIVVLVFETKLVYRFFSHGEFSSALESLAKSVESEPRLTWMLERQGFKVERVSDTNWGQVTLREFSTDCDFSASDILTYLDCRDSRYEAFIREIGYDPAARHLGACRYNHVPCRHLRAKPVNLLDRKNKSNRLRQSVLAMVVYLSGLEMI